MTVSPGAYGQSPTMSDAGWADLAEWVRIATVSSGGRPAGP
ncbi:hypothetical protein [Streptomyces vinaceus]